jgi:hypothetical protein
MFKTVKSELLLVLFSVVAVASFSASTHMPSPEEQSGVPFGYFDTEASGNMKAQQDLALGVVKYAVYGLPMKGYVDKLVANGVTPLIMGCLAGGAGSAFWTGYNAYMESKFPMLVPVFMMNGIEKSSLNPVGQPGAAVRRLEIAND